MCEQARFLSALARLYLDELDIQFHFVMCLNVEFWWTSSPLAPPPSPLPPRPSPLARVCLGKVLQLLRLSARYTKVSAQTAKSTTHTRTSQQCTHEQVNQHWCINWWITWRIKWWINWWIKWWVNWRIKGTGTRAGNSSQSRLVGGARTSASTPLRMPSIC